MTKLCCYVEGKRDIFGVSISPNSTIYDLKKKIYNAGSRTFVECDPMDLTLIKVCYIITFM